MEYNQEGFEDIRKSRISGRLEWVIIVDRERAALYGLTVKDISETLHSELRGLRATLYHTEAREIEVVSRVRKEDRDRLDDLRKLTHFSEDGAPVLLESRRSGRIYLIWNSQGIITTG